MNKKHNHIEQLTPALLEAYKKGLLNAEQQHQVEKLMLEDPFYADALVGWEEIDDTELSADLAKLESRLEGKNKIGFWTITRRLAATLLILVTASFLFFWLQNKDEAPEKFTAKKEADTKVRPTTDSLELINPNQLKKPRLTASNTGTKPKAMTLKPIADEEGLAEVAFDMSIEAEPEKADLKALSEVTETNSAQVKMEESVRMKAAKTLIEEKNEAQMARTMDVQSMLQSRVAGVRIDEPKISLTVVDASDNSPLPQVSVLIKNTLRSTATDTQGKAEIPTDSSAVYIARYLGYVSQEFRLDDLSKMNDTIRMEADETSLGEIVVSGLAKENQNRLIVRASQKAAPVMGMPDYKDYLEENIIYPENESKIRGTVRVEFTINADGSLSNFEIKKSLGTAFDTEAIRLIKEGPAWQAATDENGVSKTSTEIIRVVFKP
ncbi:TonB family protein [uncultured Roseivirga sp.]|uniref:TonB family protein n=1 Tax=uncultured Roseivirga sp. TaxID=543088 RepID=UPI0030D6E19F